MRDALLRDLSVLPNVQIITTHDNRLSSPMIGSVAIIASDNPAEIWSGLLQRCDAAFIIAPETEGKLAELVELVTQCNVLHLGCELSAINVASSKYKTYHRLLNAGINVVPTYQLNAEILTIDAQRWVVKPDDGAGCDGTVCFESNTKNRAELKQLIDTNQATHVIQPYVMGIPASISMMCKGEEAWLLACNLQKVENVDGRFIYRGGVVNGLTTYHERFAEIANQIAKAMPDLAGYVGVDVIVNADEITILEINPRLTTSFAGLHESLGINPSKLILDVFFDPQFTMPALNNKSVEVSV